MAPPTNVGGVVFFRPRFPASSTETPTMNAPRTLLTLALTLLATFAHAQSQTIDDFETIDAWSTFAPEGVRVEIKPDRGALRIDYAFERGGGFAIVKRAVNIDVVANNADA